MQPKVFIILVNWNGEKDTIACLDSLLALQYNNSHVVISDNGSTPQSLQCLKDWANNRGIALLSPETKDQPLSSTAIKSLWLIENKKNLGFTGANTAGINLAMTRGADYVLFLNNDAIATPDFLSTMVNVAESHPEYGILGCKTLLGEEATAAGKRKIWSLGGYEYVVGNPMNIGRWQWDRPEWKGVRENDLVCGCCMLIRRKVIEDIGVQDDALFFGIDDVDYSFRATRKGWKNALVLDAEIYHSASRSVEGRLGLQLYYLCRNTYYFRTRYFPWHQNIIFFSWHLFRYGLVGGVGRIVFARGRENVGLVLGIYDFLRNRMGACPHVSLFKRR